MSLIVRDVSNAVGGAGLALLICDHLGLAMLALMVASGLSHLSANIESHQQFSSEPKA